MTRNDALSLLWMTPNDALSLLWILVNGPMEGHPPIMPPELHHYDLHVWLWRENPAGVFSPTNPAVMCGKGQYSFAGDPPKMVHDH